MKKSGVEARYGDRYGARKAAGLCGGCGKQPASAASVYCESCLDKQRERQKKAAARLAAAKAVAEERERQDRKKAGTCLDCGAERYAGSKYRCRRCYALWLEKTKGLTRHDARKAAHLCASCENATEAGQVRCEACGEKRREQHAARKKSRICADCGRPNDNPESVRSCLACTAKHRDRYGQKREAGTCVKCGRAKAENGKHVCATCKLDNRRRDRKRHRKLRNQVLKAYGGACQCCGETTAEFLQVDHVANDGASHRRKIGNGGSRFYTWLRSNGFPRDGFQLLCSNCNRAKAQYGICPHQKGLSPRPDSWAKGKES